MAIPSLVARDPERARQWAQRARSEFRLSIWRGEVAFSKELADLIRKVENALQDIGARNVGDKDALGSASIGWLLNAVNSASQGDHWSSRDQLVRARNSPTAGPTLRWLADIWCARVDASLGDIETAEEVLVRARSLAQALDPATREATSCVLAEVEACADETQLALERVDAAIEAFDKMGDNRWLSAAWLTRAQILDASGFDVESVSAAERAYEADRDWVGPVLLLARRSLKKGMVDDAERRLLLATSRTDEVARELALVRHARSGNIPVWILSEYVALRDAAPTETVIGQLSALVAFHPSFAEAHATLAWGLLHLGSLEEAEELFRSLAAQEDLESSVRLSVLNGLECASALQKQKRAKRDEALTPPQGTPTIVGDAGTGSAEEAVTGEYPVAARKPEALSGDLALLSLPELLEFLRATKRTGVLALSSNYGSGSLCFISGMLVQANSPGFPESSAVEDAVSGGSETPESAAERIRGAVREFLGWAPGRFAFEPSAPCKARDVGCVVELDPQDVLMDVMGF